ncbi:hypothetical protein JCM24511_08514 [Saitozyma sp. JCM 24511]|nr:hypothetical protein JCM24511_08514 [Saitozyma sp. JCM 24511]
MDMDMDVAWCLTCSKRTTQRDPRSPYCSDTCREADTQPSTSSTTPIPLTSPVPPILASPRAVPVNAKSISPARAHHVKRPSITPLAPLPPASEVGSPSSSPPLPRDRRAFSFPAVQSPPPPPVLTKDRKPRKSSNVLPPFIRKSSVAATSLNSPALPVDSLLARPVTSSAKTTGANTPIFADSVFCSTSESSDTEADKAALRPLAPIPRPPRASNSTATIHASTLPDDRRFSTLKSQLSSARSNAHLRTRETSHSPVAAMVASSASSRSREDIISWAKAINMRRSDVSSSDDDEEDQPRGRSRTRRETLAHLPPPSTEPLDAHDERYEHESTGLGTTPKGRISYALAGLGMSGFAPIVKALTSVTSSTSPPPAKSSTPSTPGLGLQSVPAPAELSRVAVVATTLPGEDSHDAPPAHFFGGATPTLSTVSFSEVVDPSIGDNHDPVDIVMDDQSAASSGFARRPSMPLKRRQPSSSSAIPPPVPERRQQRNSLPLRPIASTATALWNISAYFRSFAPFSLNSGTNAHPAPSSVDPLDVSVDSSTPSLVRSPYQPAAPLPAIRAESPTEEVELLAPDLVRSLPMDIVHPPRGVVEERRPSSISSRRSRSREKEIAPTRSPSPTTKTQTMPRPRSRSRSRSRSRGSLSRSRSSSAGIKVAPVVPRGQTWSPDETEGQDYDGEPRRGRSRVGKALASTTDRSRSGLRSEGDSGRGRERRAEVRVEEEAQGSASRGRGRGRTPRAV